MDKVYGSSAERSSPRNMICVPYGSVTGPSILIYASNVREWVNCRSGLSGTKIRELEPLNLRPKVLPGTLPLSKT